MADTIRVSPTEKRVTHHLSLTDGTKTLGLILCDGRGRPVKDNAWSLRESGSMRTGLQIRQGDPSYSDFELPYTPFTQKAWEGGRGNEDFEKDASRYYDSFGIDTRMGDIVLAPRPTLVELAASAEKIEPISEPSTAILTSSKRYATKFTAGASVTMQSVTVKAAAGTCVIAIIQDSGGNPAGSVIATKTLTVHESDCDGSGTSLVTAVMSGSLVSGTSYWVVVTTSKLEIGSLTGGITKFEDGTWQPYTADKALYYRITTLATGKVEFFVYRGAQYAVTMPDSGGTSRLYLNGYRGVCAAGTTASVLTVSAGLGLTTNELAGKIVKITAGVCYGEDPNWRLIVSNTSTTITLATPFLNTPNTTSEFVILGVDKWTEITSTGFTTRITSVCVANDIVYFAQGEDATIRRMREYNSSGTFTRQFDWDGSSSSSGNKATFLQLIPTSGGKLRIWKFNNPASAQPTAAYATPINWSTSDLNFTSKPSDIGANAWPIPCGDFGSKITGVGAYGSPVVPWIFKEDEFGSINNGVYAPVPIGELRSVRAEINGKAALQFGVYLFLNVLDGLERYYDNRLDDIGPNRDEGLPAGRNGIISALASYPGGLFAAIDAGSDGTSCVMFWNQMGWHEIYRAPAGERIRSLAIQVMPGDMVDRLWIDLANRTAWLPVALNPRKLADYRYISRGQIISSWFKGGFGEIKKFWKSVQLWTENLTANVKIAVEYQTDVNSTWYALPSDFTASPMAEVLMTADYSVYGKRWRYRLTLTTNNSATTPRVKAITIPAVTRLIPTRAWSVTVLIDDQATDLQGVRQEMSAIDYLAQLAAWASSDAQPVPLIMRSALSRYDNLRVFVEAPSSQPISATIFEKRSTKLVCTLTINEA